jgi:CDP-glucose 4,6-dehydratase
VVVQSCSLEGLAMNAGFWEGKRVLLTGHTGFKGSWLAVWLQKLGATVAGYALPPPHGANLFALAAVAERMDESIYGDIRELQSLRELVDRFRPEIVFHLAAQSLVRISYLDPLATYQINVMGTANLLESLRNSSTCRAVVVVTSDKCYENSEWVWGYRENDPLGGHDPYSSSKGCAELVTAAYRRSFFRGGDATAIAAIASARAGNVIGGGDFSKDRLVPDLMAAISASRPLRLRNPDAIRPWQHVLEPLSGYLLLAERLWSDPDGHAQSWNFGPAQECGRSVLWLVERLGESWGETVRWQRDVQPSPHEAHFLTLDSAKARGMLGWKPRWTLEDALLAVVDWYKSYGRGEAVRDVLTRQIVSYESTAHYGEIEAYGNRSPGGHTGSACKDGSGDSQALPAHTARGEGVHG